MKTARTNTADCDNKRLIVLRSQSVVQNSTGKHNEGHRSGKRQWIAEYPYKGHIGVGRTKQEALADLLGQISGYLELEIRG